jgi:4,5:9,10-diseco-3-hydroxy-5,9,17-trioxoandrosta-1(10),2-diene-4-oate hydrolase
MSVRPLAPDEMYPAHAAGATARFVDLPTGVRVRIVEAGARGAPPVVMLHGWGASLYTFRHGLELLPARGFHVVAVDMRGFGLSSHPEKKGAYTLDAYAADLDALLEELALPARPALVGHSMGGGLALHFALDQPSRVSALALIAPTGLVRTPALLAVRVAPRSVAEALGERVITRRVVRMILEHIAFGDTSHVTDRDVDEYWAPTQIDGYIRAVRGTAAEFDWTPLTGAAMRSLSVPVAVVLGTNDRLVRHAGVSARRLAGSSVYEISGGHCVHEERPGEVYETIGDHLGRFTARGPDWPAIGII